MAKYFSDQSYLYSKQTFEELPLASRTDKQFVLKCLARNGLLYSILSPELKEDEDVILRAVKQDSDAYTLIQEKFKTDVEFLRKIVEQNPLVYSMLPEEIRSKREFVLTAISHEGIDALWSMPLSIFQDVEIIVAALKSHNGSDDDVWEGILCAAGEEAEFSKNVIQQGYKVHGERVLEMTFTSLLNEHKSL
jgi:hypothetical protein